MKPTTYNHGPRSVCHNIRRNLAGQWEVYRYNFKDKTGNQSYPGYLVSIHETEQEAETAATIANEELS